MTLPGFELLFSGIQSQIRSPQDAVVSAIHWSVITAGFKLNGIGENPAGGRECTETLPAGWNTNEIYIFHYLRASTDPPQNFLLKILPVDASLLLHFQREGEENVFTLELSIQEYSSQDLSSAATAVSNIDRLNARVRQSLLDPAMGGLLSSGSNCGESSSPNSCKDKKNKKKYPLQVEDHRPPFQAPPVQPAWPMGSGLRDPFSVGRSDLDPLSGMGGPGFNGGGMIMDPRYSGGPRFGNDPGGFGGFGGPSRGGGIHPGALPPGSVPPGARFDPIGPGGMRPGPDPDHEQPPSGYDDMFM